MKAYIKNAFSMPKTEIRALSTAPVALTPPFFSEYLYVDYN